MSRTTLFDSKYALALSRIMECMPSKNERTGKWVRALNGLYIHTLDFQFPIVHLRDISPMWSCAESVWFLSGARSTDLMQKYGFGTWDKFSGPDGMVHSATGYRWRAAHAVDQLQAVLDKLAADRTSRQAVMISWLPQKDLLDPGPNAPCILTWHFHIMDNRLHMNVLQRSADMYFGFPHDILGFRIVQELMAAKLKTRVGEVGYLISNAHLYEDQWSAATQMMARAMSAGPMEAGDFALTVDEHTIGKAMDGLDSLPLEMYQQINGWYKPWPAISGPRLVK
jgi:thymidylate synthase